MYLFYLYIEIVFYFKKSEIYGKIEILLHLNVYPKYFKKIKNWKFCHEYLQTCKIDVL